MMFRLSSGIYCRVKLLSADVTSEMSVDNNFTRQYIPEDNSEHQDWKGLFCTANTCRRPLQIQVRFKQQLLMKDNVSYLTVSNYMYVLLMPFLSNVS
jgi:hypothetical protein